MNDDKNNENYYLSFIDIINESLIRDLILFSFLFILILTQIWDNIFLLLFPLITFSFSLFFRIINTNKWRTELDDSPIIFNPLGLEKKHANRLFFSALIQLLLVFWIGNESLYQSHLIMEYIPYFTILFIFSYTFGFFWIFLDFWKYSKIEIITRSNILKPSQDIDKGLSLDLNEVISFLKLKQFILISIVNFSLFIVLNLINLISMILILNDFPMRLELNLPGTRSQGSNPLPLPLSFYGFLTIPPIVTIIFMFFNYNFIININIKKLKEILEPLPKTIQIKVIENLKNLNKKIEEQLKIE
ncbi:MAG: hypothetical protein ACFFB0_09815 [Promethearchaeota archaeon]